MSSITSVSAALPIAKTVTEQSGSSGSLDANAFLKLLVAELQNQDPTKPMDTAELVQQLASLSQVQQSATTNAKLSAILDTISIGQAASVIGRTLSDGSGQTEGVVESVRLTESGMIARLAGGREVLIGAGTTISA